MSCLFLKPADGVPSSEKPWLSCQRWASPRPPPPLGFPAAAPATLSEQTMQLRLPISWQRRILNTPSRSPLGGSPVRDRQRSNEKSDWVWGSDRTRRDERCHPRTQHGHRTGTGGLTAREIRALLHELDRRLAARGIHGNINAVVAEMAAACDLAMDWPTSKASVFIPGQCQLGHARTNGWADCQGRRPANSPGGEIAAQRDKDTLDLARPLNRCKTTGALDAAVSLGAGSDRRPASSLARDRPPSICSADRAPKAQDQPLFRGTAPTPGCKCSHGSMAEWSTMHAVVAEPSQCHSDAQRPHPKPPVIVNAVWSCIVECGRTCSPRPR